MTDPDPPDLAPLDLDARTGWPAELRLLLDRHPRAGWEARPDLGALARFWLQRHAMFRELAAALAHATAELRDGRVEAAAFQPWFRPRMGFLLQELEGHHTIEDRHYFPVLQAAEPRLARGFAVLDADHHTLHRAIDELARASNGLLRAFAAPTADRPAATAALATALPAFTTRLARHLDDEEDLIVPLLLERGETSLGVA